MRWGGGCKTQRGILPSKDSMLKWGFRRRPRRASWTVWTVALLPEPWKARRVGLTGAGDAMVPGELESEVRGGGFVCLFVCRLLRGAMQGY